jgi:hypothetical protein
MREIKNSEIKDRSLVSDFSLFEDSRAKYVEVFLNTYPYTIEYEWETEFDGLLFFPNWMPQEYPAVSVQNSEFKVIIPEKLNFRYKEKNLKTPVRIENSGDTKVFLWSAQNMPAFEPEQFSPRSRDFLPFVITAPDEFMIENRTGKLDTWKNFGGWIYQLNRNRNQLPVETKTKIQSLISGITDKKEIAKKLYEYMQSKTRYVGIQIGIGGLQPFEAKVVDKNGYGDCKALSNYMQALLEEAGIPSYYTLISGDENENKNLLPDFPNAGFNHVILCIPYEKDTVFLECTNQKIPFGYIGNFTDDRDALLITPDGGQITHTTKYAQLENSQFRKADVTIEPTGNIKVKIRTTYAGLQYDNVSGLFDLNIENQKKILYEGLTISNMNIESVAYTNEKNRLPKAIEQLGMSVNNYATVSNNRVFVTLNLLNKKTYIPPDLKERRTNIFLKMAYYDADTIQYQLPEGYQIEYKPQPVQITSEFGEYQTNIIAANNTITYIRIIKMNEGLFPAEKYNELKDFYKKIVNSDKEKLVLLKNK